MVNNAALLFCLAIFYCLRCLRAQGAFLNTLGACETATSISYYIKLILAEYPTAPLNIYRSSFYCLENLQLYTLFALAATGLCLLYLTVIGSSSAAFTGVSTWLWELFDHCYQNFNDDVYYDETDDAIVLCIIDTEPRFEMMNVL